MSIQYYRQNFGFGLLGTQLEAGDISMVVQSGHNFPFDTTKYFKLIIWDSTTYSDPGSDPNYEIVTANWSGTLNTYTVSRGEENTVAIQHKALTSLSMSITAGSFPPADPTTIVWATPGTYTWTCPTGITRVLVSGVGGGGGGAGGWNASYHPDGSGGGSGAALIKYVMTVDPGHVYTIVVGSAGVGGGIFTNGTDGGNSAFGSLTLPHGYHGIVTNGAQSNGGASGWTNSPNYQGADATTLINGIGGGGFAPSGSGGKSAPVSGSYGYGYGGGGGGNPYGKGGDGGNASAVVHGGDGTGYGSGGGGGSGSGSGVGGNGACGFISIEF